MNSEQPSNNGAGPLPGQTPVSSAPLESAGVTVPLFVTPVHEVKAFAPPAELPTVAAGVDSDSTGYRLQHVVATHGSPGRVDHGIESSTPSLLSVMSSRD